MFFRDNEIAKGVRGSLSSKNLKHVTVLWMAMLTVCGWILRVLSASPKFRMNFATTVFTNIPVCEISEAQNQQSRNHHRAAGLRY